MLVRDTWEFPNHIEYEYKFPGMYGAKGERRSEERKERTPEEMRRQNQRNRETRVRRLIKANFFPEDLWVTLKYPKGARPGAEKAEKDFKKFLRKLRKAYKDKGEELKFIYRMEIGKRGGVQISAASLQTQTFASVRSATRRASLLKLQTPATLCTL